MTDYFNLVNGILLYALNAIDKSFYSSVSSVFNNDFFESAFALSIAWFGLQIALKTFKTEEAAYKIIWTIFIFILIKIILIDKSLYETVIEFLDLPRNVALDFITLQMKEKDNFKGVGDIIRTLIASNDLLISSIMSNVKMFNLLPVIYGLILWISSVFLLLTLFLSTIFSMFIAKILITLFPLILITLLAASTQKMFFGFVKLYISISLYTPFALLFATMSVNVTKFTVLTTKTLHDDFMMNYEYIFALVLVQFLFGLAILKIPNMVNQIIGSKNDNNTFLSSVGAMSFGSFIVGKLSKMGGIKYTGGVSYNARA